MGNEDSFDGWEVYPVLDKYWSNSVDYNDDSPVFCCYCFDKLVSVMPGI
jgi:hypothetical protein